MSPRIPVKEKPQMPCLFRRALGAPARPVMDLRSDSDEDDKAVESLKRPKATAAKSRPDKRQRTDDPEAHRRHLAIVSAVETDKSATAPIGQTDKIATAAIVQAGETDQSATASMETDQIPTKPKKQTPKPKKQTPENGSASRGPERTTTRSSVQCVRKRGRRRSGGQQSRICYRRRRRTRTWRG